MTNAPNAAEGENGHRHTCTRSEKQLKCECERDARLPPTHIRGGSNFKLLRVAAPCAAASGVREREAAQAGCAARVWVREGRPLGYVLEEYTAVAVRCLNWRDWRT